MSELYLYAELQRLKRRCKCSKLTIVTVDADTPDLAQRNTIQQTNTGVYFVACDGTSVQLDGVSVFGTTEGVPVDAPESNESTVRIDESTGDLYYWDGDSWESLIRSDAADIRSTTYVLTSAEVIGMNAAPVVIVPGEAGKILSFIKGVTTIFPGGTQFTGGGAVTAREETSGIILGSNLISNVTVNGASEVTSVAATGLTNPFQIAGRGMTISNATAPFAAGTGTLQVTVLYEVVTI